MLFIPLSKTLFTETWNVTDTWFLLEFPIAKKQYAKCYQGWRVKRTVSAFKLMCVCAHAQLCVHVQVHTCVWTHFGRLFGSFIQTQIGTPLIWSSSYVPGYYSLYLKILPHNILCINCIRVPLIVSKKLKKNESTNCSTYIKQHILLGDKKKWSTHKNTFIHLNGNKCLKFLHNVLSS